MSRLTVVLTTLIVYQIVLLGIGFYASRRTQDDTDFYLGGRELGPWVAALSASASSSSAWTLLGVSGAAYTWGVSAAWLLPACIGGFVFNWFVLAPAVQRVGHATGSLTVIELIAGPKDRPLSRIISGVCATIVLLAFTIYVAAQLQGAGKTFDDTFGLGVTPSILIGAGVVVVYTLMGGFWAASLSDAVQAVAMVGASLLLPMAVVWATGGPLGLVDGMANVQAEGWLNPLKEASPLAGAGFVAALLGIGLGYPGQPHVVNRFMAMKDTPGAMRTARTVAVGWAVIIYTGMLVVGWGGRVLFPELADAELVFIHATNELFSPVVSGLLLAAVLSAVMSTADSQLLAAGSSVSHDLGFGGRGGSALLGSRLVVLAVSALAIVAAIYGSQTIFDKVLSAWFVVGFALGPAVCVTALKGPIPPARTLLAVLVGGGMAFVTNLVPAVDKTSVEAVLPFVAGLLIVWPWDRESS